ncbi:MAG TPA: sporulation protein YqfD [Candidatus Anaerofilum excrementigallinarum]|nr:sporulation protein YqfD [Candidatus Anaerofilum excrementigallinarum]
MLGWLLGRVRFRAEGGDAEKLLTACAGQGIPVSGVRATALGFTAWTPARCYHRLRPLARRSHTRVRLAKKQGLCFVLLRWRGRWGLVLGPLVLAAVLAFSGNVVWAIRFDGLPAAQQIQLRSQLLQAGIWEGAWLRPDSLDAARQELLAQNEEYSWLTLNFYRGRLVVEASQLRPAPELPQGRSCDLVSVADGVVLEVNIQSGQPLCSPGQTVAKGQQLAAGRYQDRDGRLFEVQSAGEVMAQVTFRCQAQQPMETTVALPQSGGRRGRRLLVLGQTIPLGPQPQAGPEEQASVTSRPLTILGFALPATLEETWVTGSVQQTVTFTEEQALELAKLACREQLLQQLSGAEIRSERVYSRLEQGKLQVEMELVAVAQIAQQQPCEN